MTLHDFNALPLLLRLRQVRQATGFSREVIAALVERGELQTRRVLEGGRLYYLKESVSRFVSPH